MTLLADPPDTSSTPISVRSSSHSSASTWRLASRLARRETRRRPGRTVLVSLLIAIPVMAMTLGSVLVRTNAEGRAWPAQFERRYGDADIAVDAAIASFTFENPPSAALPSGTRELDYLWVLTFLQPVDPADEADFVVLTDAPLDDPMVSSAVEIVDGRTPTSGEVLIGPDLAAARGLAPGDELALGRPSGSWTISGIGRYRDDHRVDLVVIPDFDRARVVPERQELVELYDLPDDLDSTAIISTAGSLGGLTRFEDPYAGFWRPTPILAWGWVGGVLSLVAVGIIVAAAFATSARRQLVTVGQLASNGATQAVIRRSLALQGTWTATIGTAFGMALGVAALPFVRGAVEGVLNYELRSYVVSVRDLVAIAVTAIVAGTIAASVPARSAARVPVMSALAGRRPQATPPRWLVPTGLALTAGGLGLLVVAGTGARADSSNSFVWPLLVVVGVVGVVFGMICATPLVVASIGRLGRSSPLSWRFALRSLGRSRTRSAAVVAALAVTVGGAVAGSAVVENVMRHDSRWDLPAMPADAFVVMQYDDVSCCEGVVDAGPLPSVDVPDDVAARLDALFPRATSAPLVVATYDPPRIDWRTYDGPHPDRQGPIVATPAMLDILGLHPDDVATLHAEGQVWPREPNAGVSSDAVVSETGEVVAAGTSYPTEGDDIALNPPIGAHVPRYGFALYRPIITPEFARNVGFDLVERGIIVRNDRSLTVDQRESLATSFRFDDPWANGVFIEPGDPPVVTPDESSTAPYWSFGYDDPSWRSAGRDLWRTRVIMVVAVLLLTSLVVAIGLSLAAAEGRDERNVLAVVGARPSSVRRQAAARGVVLAVVGIALGIPTGYAPTWVLFRTVNIGSIDDGFTEPLRFPWIVAASIVVVIPLGVAAIAWAGSGVAQRSRPASPTRHD